MTAGKFTVVGGRYRDTTFREPAVAGRLDRHGAFPSWKQAYACWSRLSWQHVDDCYARYVICDGDGHICAEDPSSFRTSTS